MGNEGQSERKFLCFHYKYKEETLLIFYKFLQYEVIKKAIML